MTDNVDFDALAQKTINSNGALEDLNNLYGAVFALPEWHFIARGELPNLSPYIAANADYADGQQMVRAFTDTNRLLRFAKENNLVQTDGSAPILSLPTAGIVEYLEQFTAYGVHGVWFNSDTGSDGFFLPLKQLRPVKEHLAKINWRPPAAAAPASAPTAATEPAIETLVVTVKDGLMLPSGFVSEASYACNFFCRVPAGWTTDGKLKSNFLEKIYEQVYGENWRAGNSDDSRYIVIDSSTKVLTPDEVHTAKWSETQNTKENHFWFYIASETGEIKKATAEEFQAHVDAARPPETETGAAQPLQSSAPEAFGFAGSLDGETDLNLAYLRKGEVSFDTAIAPFQEKIVPLLANYRGAGEYQDIIPLDANALEGLAENTLSNAHGPYLRIRRFFYQPDNGAMFAVSTIDSNQLRQTETDAALRVNFALMKNLVTQTALLYFRLEGPKSEVLDLSAALAPLLEGCGFKEIPGK